MIACMVWAIAGINLIRIGFEAYDKYLTLFNIFMSFLVFFVFQFFIFRQLVKKHKKRIYAYQQRQCFFKFFDIRSFVIMAVMMSGGMWFRTSSLASQRVIAVFYSGLGISLLWAGMLFGISFIEYIKLNKR